MEVQLPGCKSIAKGVSCMSLHKDFIKKAVNDAVKKHGLTVLASFIAVTVAYVLIL